MSFGKNLQTLRERAGLSQSQLADKAGISVKTLQNWEVDGNQPGIEVAAKLAKALGVSLDRLAADAGELPPAQKPAPPPAKKPRGRAGKWK